MDARDERKVRALLEGRLSARETREFLERMRNHPEFRERLEFASQAAPTSAWQPSEGPRYTHYSPEEVEAARSARLVRNRRWLVLSLFMIVMLTTVGVVMRPQEASEERDIDVICRETLARGIPFPLHPDGPRHARPNIFEALLPEGAGDLQVRIRRQGVVIHEKTWRPGMKGADFHPAEGVLGEETYPLIQVVVPFPPSAELPLETEVSYDYVMRTGDGAWSVPRSFRILP